MTSYKITTRGHGENDEHVVEAETVMVDDTAVGLGAVIAAAAGGITVGLYGLDSFVSAVRIVDNEAVKRAVARVALYLRDIAEWEERNGEVSPDVVDTSAQKGGEIRRTDLELILEHFEGRVS